MSLSPALAFGISSYAYPWAIGMPSHRPAHPMNALQLLQEAKRLRAQRLQLADNLPVHQLAEEAWQILVGQAREWNIQLELGLRGLRTERLLTYLQLARQCQSPFVRVVIDEHGFEPTHNQIVGSIREVLPPFKTAGICLAIENHDRFRAHELVGIIEATDPEYVGICLDTANSLGADEGIWEVAQTLAPYTLNVHIKDYQIRRLDHQMGFTVQGTPAGSGQTPIVWLLELLAPYRRCQSATLETWLAPLATLEETIKQEREWVNRGSAFLRNSLQELILSSTNA